MILEHVRTAPNPQFVREDRVDLTGDWEFAYDDANEGLRESWFAMNHALSRQITVPYPPESPLSGINDTSFHKTLWYRRTFTDPRSDNREHLMLRFGAVDYRATVWVNGRFVGSHEGGSTPFAFDITYALSPEKTEHVVTVRVEDDPRDTEQPRGKQVWHETPSVIHYHRTSGIWQPVWLEIVPDVHIEDVRWQFNPADWTVAFEATLTDRPPSGSTFSVDLEILDTSVTTSCTVQDRRVRGSIDVSQGNATNRERVLWSPDHPNLFGVRLTLTSPGQPPDVVLSYIGLRTIDIDTRTIRLNGVALYQRLVLNQGYWPESHLAAPSPDALKREVELILALGFNGARNHQKIEDPRFLFWADTLGLLLWGEIGNAFTWSDLAISRHAREWREMVVRDRNHPSIITWVPFNESWGVDNVGHSPNQAHAVKAAYHTTYQLDGTRPVVSNDGWENVIGDMLTIHDYAWDPAVLDHRYGSGSTPEDMVERYELGHRRLVVGDYPVANKPVILSEFGGVSFAPKSDERWFGYGKVNSPEEFLAKYRDLTSTVSGSSQLAGFCYTQLTDTVQETNGLLTEHREPKVDIEEIRKITIGNRASRKRPSAQ